MYITEFVSTIVAGKKENFVPKTTGQGLITKKPVSYEIITNSAKELSNNLKNVLSDLIKKENLFEARNDLKIYINTAVLETPKEFEAAKITEQNKNRIKAFIISKKDSIKIKATGLYIEFKKETNKSIDKVITSSSLDSILSSSNDVKQLYKKIIDEITNNLTKNFRPMIQAEKRSMKVNIHKKVGELVAIKLVAPNTSTRPEIAGGSYYEHEPNGPGTFPDYIFYFGKIENEDAKEIRRVFKVPDNINRISFEAKTATRIVGKQRTPKTFLKNLKDKEIFNKMTNLKVGETINLNIDEVLDILRADGIGIDKWTAYLNPAGSTQKTQAKRLKWIADFAPFKLKRNTPGQMAILGNIDKALFKIEIGSTAYKTGDFKIKENTENVLGNLLLEVRNGKA